MAYDMLMRGALKTVEQGVASVCLAATASCLTRPFNAQVPDFLLRRAIRYLLGLRLRELKAPGGEEQQRRLLVRAPLFAER